MRWEAHWYFKETSVLDPVDTLFLMNIKQTNFRNSLQHGKDSDASNIWSFLVWSSSKENSAHPIYIIIGKKYFWSKYWAGRNYKNSIYVLSEE